MSSGNGKGRKVAFLRWKQQDLVTNRNAGHKGGEGGKENPGFEEYLKYRRDGVPLSLCPYLFRKAEHSPSDRTFNVKMRTRHSPLNRQDTFLGEGQGPH